MERFLLFEQRGERETHLILAGNEPGEVLVSGRGPSREDAMRQLLGNAAGGMLGVGTERIDVSAPALFPLAHAFELGRRSPDEHEHAAFAPAGAGLFADEASRTQAPVPAEADGELLRAELATQCQAHAGTDAEVAGAVSHALATGELPTSAAESPAVLSLGWLFGCFAWRRDPLFAAAMPSELTAAAEGRLALLDLVEEAIGAGGDAWVLLRLLADREACEHELREAAVLSREPTARGWALERMGQMAQRLVEHGTTAESADAFLDRAEALLRGQPEQALALLAKVEPGGRAEDLRGGALILLKRWREATEALRASLEFPYPSVGYVYDGLVVCANWLDELPSASRYALLEAAHLPGNGYALRQATNAARLCGALDRAEELAGRYANVEGPVGQALLGLVRQERGANDAADEAFAQAMARASTGSERSELAKVLGLQARALRKRGDLAGALEAATRASRLLPEDGPSLHLLAEIQFDRGDWEAALGHLEPLLAANAYWAACGPLSDLSFPDLAAARRAAARCRAELVAEAWQLPDGAPPELVAAWGAVRQGDLLGGGSLLLDLAEATDARDTRRAALEAIRAVLRCLPNDDDGRELRKRALILL